MNYWLDLFTGTTWKEFRDAGAKVSGFSPRRRSLVSRVEPGDILLCYLTGVMRWVGALRVLGPSNDKRDIWKGKDFSARLAVEPIVVLDPENGVPMDDLKGKVAFYRGPEHAGKFDGFLRASPTRFKRLEDGQLVLELVKRAELNPVPRPVDPRKLARQPLFKAQQRIGKRTVETLVSVPGPEPPASEPAGEAAEVAATTRHTEIQHLLAVIGAEMGLDIWIARNDRKRAWQGHVLGELPRVVNELPTQFNDATQRTIELIDVLWLRSNSIVAAFEVECTTSIYSGLLRMSDLLALQPNLEIKLYLVAPDDRREKVAQELVRPTFQFRTKPLGKICGFLAFSKFVEKVERIRELRLAASLDPAFLDSTAEYFDAGTLPGR